MIPNGRTAILAVATSLWATASLALEAPPADPAAVDATIRAWIRIVVRAIEIAGIAAIVVGALLATAIYARALMKPGRDADPYRTYRSNLGRAILLGLEFLVAADIIGTVAIEPSLDSLAVLAGIVLIRTFLSFSLEVEIERRLPWQSADRRSGSAEDRT